jgi:thiol-disulfide isomerase/thioredoxin
MAHHGGPSSLEPIFSDISISDPYYESVSQLHSMGFIQGNPDGTLRGEQSINRAELATIVIRASGRIISENDKNCFPDVKEEWFAGSICAAKRTGSLHGYPDGLFRPEREVTAGESAKILLNLLTLSNHTDLSVALSSLEKKRLYLEKVEVDAKITRSETFERFYRILLDQNNTPDQQDSMGNPFDPEIDPILNHLGAGTPTYVEYSQNIYSRFLSESPMILFFHAPWCPLCRKSDEVLLEIFDELKGGVIWVKVDYDTETELRKKYAVTYQDTFVIINAKGEVVSKGNTLGSSPESAQQWMDLALLK